ncbi:MAG: metalloregulator ArsR/SmtB family transcription factor [Fimbriimonadales bacterium]
MMEEGVRRRAAAIFASLGHPNRLAIVELLLDGEMTVTEIVQRLGMPQPTVSNHLAALTRAGALLVEQRGTYRFFRPRGPRIGRMLKLIRQYCHAQGLEDFSEEEDDE